MFLDGCFFLASCWMLLAVCCGPLLVGFCDCLSKSGNRSGLWVSETRVSVVLSDIDISPAVGDAVIHHILRSSRPTLGVLWPLHSVQLLAEGTIHSPWVGWNFLWTHFPGSVQALLLFYLDLLDSAVPVDPLRSLIIRGRAFAVPLTACSCE